MEVEYLSCLLAFDDFPNIICSFLSSLFINAYYVELLASFLSNMLQILSPSLYLIFFHFFETTENYVLQ